MQLCHGPMPPLGFFAAILYAITSWFCTSSGVQSANAHLRCHLTINDTLSLSHDRLLGMLP